MSGRKKDNIWIHFTEQPTNSGKGTKARCNMCGKIIMGLVARLKKHVEQCCSESEAEAEGNVDRSFLDQDSDKRDTLMETVSHQGEGQKPNASITITNKRKLVNESNASKRCMSDFIVKTSQSQKQVFDEQIARYIYATNSSFHSVQHTEFKKMVSVLHPGYSPPTEVEIGGNLLNTIYEQENKKCSEILKGQFVNLSLDGWSNIHNEPVVCGVVTNNVGDTFLVNSINTLGHSHTTEYLVDLAKTTLKKCEEEYKCIVRSIVTDNASNVKSMRAELEKKDQDENLNLITYGCSAHLLNLLAQDLNIPNVVEHVTYIVKYFRNNQLASAHYKKAGGLKLILPQEVRWNTTADCLNLYIKHWPILINVCEANRDDIEPLVYNKIINLGIKRNAEDLLERLKPISKALDEMQKKDCLISNAVHLWKDLGKKIKNLNQSKECVTAFNARYKQALDSAHFLAYLLDPRYAGENLTKYEENSALSYAKEKYSKMVLPIILKFQAKAAPFNEILFEKNIVKEVSPLDWWKTRLRFIVKKKNKKNENADIDKERDNESDDDFDYDKQMKNMEIMINQLFTAIASSASVERMFSTFGLVHSKIRNRLGTDKAAKLVFLHQSFNKKK